MIDTLHFLPPDLGPRSNPVLFGIAEALALLLPVAILAPHPSERPAGLGGESGPVVPMQAETHGP